MIDTVKVRVPATTANCGPGFDAIGIACTLYNTVELSLRQDKSIHVEVSGEGEADLPRDNSNIIIQAVQSVLKRVGSPYQGIKLKVHNNIPLSRGLGSSATAIVAGLVAANEATGRTLTTQEIFDMATEFEGHPDNVAPALFGGITLSYVEAGKAGCLKFMPPAKLQLVAVVPEFTLATSLARKALPEVVPLADAVFNISRTALLVGALCKGDFEHLKYALQDKIHQPYRQHLIPGMSEVFTGALSNGALGAVISGAGSTLMAYTTEDPEAIGGSMVEAFAAKGIASRYIILDIDTEGVKVV